jgi:hypothetical protein
MPWFARSNRPVQNNEALDLGSTGSGPESIGPSTIPDGQTDATLGVISPVSGRVSAIATHPWDARIVFVGGAQGGVWKTVNATSANPTWTPLTDKYFSLAIGHIAIDPVNPKIVYVGTGEANRSCDSTTVPVSCVRWTAARPGRGFAAARAAVQQRWPFMAGYRQDRHRSAPAGSSTGTTLWAATTSGAFYRVREPPASPPAAFGLWRPRTAA